MIRVETDFNRMYGPGTLFIANATKKIPEQYRREGTCIFFYDSEGVSNVKPFSVAGLTKTPG